MARRYFNWTLLIVIVIGAATVVGTLYGVRRHLLAKTARAEQSLPIGLKAYDAGDWEAAATHLGKYIVADREDPNILFKYANAQTRIRPRTLNRFRQAISAYRNVLRLDPSNVEAVKNLAGIYLRSSPAEAELITRNHLQNNDDPEIRRLLAIAMATQRKFSEARDELLNIMREHPERVDAYETLAFYNELRPDQFQDDPEELFNQAVQNNPTSARAYLARARFYLRHRESAKALADIEQAEKLDISDVDIKLQLAAALTAAQLHDRAKEHFEAVRSLDPTNENLWKLWANLVLRSGSQEEMVQIADQGLENLANQPWDFMPVAIELYIRADRLDEASECTAKMRDKEVTLGKVEFLDGMIADRKGNVREAARCWQRAIALGQADPRTRLALSFALSRLGDLQSAIGQLRVLTTDAPQSFEAHMRLAELLATTRNWPETAEIAGRAAQLAPPDETRPALLQLQARMQLIARGGEPNTADASVWGDIETRLSDLDKKTDGSLEVKLLQVQAALFQANLDQALKIAGQLRQKYPDDARSAMAAADVLLAQDENDQAIKLLQTVVERFPQDANPVRMLALILNQQGRKEQCATVIGEALDRLENPAGRRLLGLLLADLHTLWGDTDGAYARLDKLAKQSPDDIGVLRKLLACRQVSEDPARAQELVDRIKTLEGQDGWQWRYEQARMWSAEQPLKEHHTEIVSLLQENLLASPGDQASRMLLAAVYERAYDLGLADSLQLAVTTYRQALDRWPDNVLIIKPTVLALYKATQHEEADEILARAERRGVNDPELERLQLQSNIRRGQLGSAIDILKKQYELDPNDATAGLSLALMLMRQNRLDEAGDLLDKLAVREPDSLSVLVAQVQLNVQRGNSSEALRICDQVISRFSNPFAYNLRARTLMSLGQTAKALEAFTLTIEVHPDNADVWMARAGFLQSLGRGKDAVSDARKGLAKAPDSIRLQKRAIPILLASHDISDVLDAEKILDKALLSAPEDVDLRLMKVRVLMSRHGTQSALRQAEQILDDITASHPQTTEAWGLRGDIYLGRGQPGKAVDAALRGLAHRPDDRRLLLLKARAEQERSPMLAVPTLRLLLEKDPNDVEVALALARAYIDAGEPRKAVDLMRAYVQRPANLQRRECEAVVATGLYKSGDKQGAQAILDTMTRVEPDDPMPVLTLARLLADDKLWNRVADLAATWMRMHPNDSTTPTVMASGLAAQKSEQAATVAENLLRETLRHNPDSIDALNTLAMLLQSQGRQAESAKLNRRILDLEPNSVIALNNLAWTLCEGQHKYKEALELAKRGLQIAPQYADVRDTRGVILYRMGEYGKAADDFTQCLRMYPDDAPASVIARFHLARALAGLGRKSEAVDELHRTLNLHSRFEGLTPDDLEEARQLLGQLQKGG